VPRKRRDGCAQRGHPGGITLPQKLAARIGIHSGLAVIEDLGTGRMLEPASVVGDTINIASRLQTAAAPNTVLISAATAELAGGQFQLTDLGERALAGVAEPLRVFEVGAEPAAAGAPSLQGKGQVAPFVDRHGERAQLRRAWAKALKRQGPCLVIEAEAGMGKTRLVREFAAGLARNGARATVITCSADDGMTSFQPLLSWLRGELDLPPGARAPALRAALRAALAPAPGERHELHLAVLLDVATREEQAALALAPRRRRRETIDALLAFLALRLDPDHPHLLVIEDIQWADEGTLAFARALEERRAGSKTMVLLTTRPQHASRVDFASGTLALQRLPEEEATRLVRAMARPHTPDEAIQRIVQRTDGIPLFVEEVTRFALADQEAGAASRRPGRNAIPLTLRGILTAQLDRLGKAKGVAQIAAVLGRSFRRDLLQAVMDEADAAEVETKLSQLVSARFLEPEGLAGEPTGYLFRHALIRDAAYDSILRDRRKALHARTARIVRDRFPETAQFRPEILAQHYALAGMPLDAAGHYEAAARRAASRSNHHEAAEHCRAGLQQLDLLESGVETAESEIRLLILLAAQITSMHGNAHPGVLEAFERARQVAEAAGHRRWMQRALRGLHTFFLVRGEIGAGHRISQQVRALAGAPRDAGDRIQLHRPHGLTLLYMGEFEEARRELGAVCALYDPAEHAGHRFEYGSDPMVLARCHLGWVEWFLGDVDRAAHESAAAIAAARDLAHPHSLAFAMAFQGCLAQFMNDPVEAGGIAMELVQLAEQHEFAYWSAWARIVLGWSRAASGEAGEGEAMLRQGLADYEANGAGLLVPYANLLLAEIVAADRPQEAQRLRMTAQRKAEQGGMGIWSAWSRRGCADASRAMPPGGASRAAPCGKAQEKPRAEAPQTD
jgi:hypothetical protein